MGLKYEFFDGGSDPSKKRKMEIDRPPMGRTATEIDANMRDDGWGGLFKTDQERDYCKFLEKGLSNGYTNGNKMYLRPKHIKSLMKQYGKYY